MALSPHPLTSIPQPFCLSVAGMFPACTVLVQPTQIPRRVSIFRYLASKGKPWVRHTGVSSMGRQPRPGKSCWTKAPHPCYMGNDNCKPSAPGGIVILPRVSPKEQHHTRQDVKSSAFDVLQQPGNENKQSAPTGKLGHWKTSVKICWGFISPSFFF